MGVKRKPASDGGVGNRHLHASPPKRAAHRPAYVPTEKDRGQVQAMAGFGIDHASIAELLGMRAPALRRHFRKELDLGAVKANALVAQKLFEKATTGNELNAMIFWLRTRAGWKETTTIEGDLGFGAVIEALEKRRKRSSG